MAKRKLIAELIEGFDALAAARGGRCSNTCGRALSNVVVEV